MSVGPLPKVVVSYEPTSGFVDDLRKEFPKLEIKFAVSLADQLHHIQDADIYIGWISQQVFKQAKSLKWVQVPGTGVDGVLGHGEDSDGTFKYSPLVDSDVVVTNCPGSHAEPMANHVMGMVVSLAHQFPRIYQDQNQRKWDTASYHNQLRNLTGTKMGIFGLGDIGVAVAKRAYAFGMHVIGVDANSERDIPDYLEEIWGPEKLEDMLRVSDWVVVATPLTSDTKNALNRNRLNLIKHGAFLVVISRGGIVDEDALVDALRSGRLSGASLDTTDVEPLPNDSQLWDVNNLIISPHVSAETPDTFQGRTDVIKENLRRYLRDEEFIYVCDKKAGY